jgi:hypothetical protein
VRTGLHVTDITGQREVARGAVFDIHDADSRAG